MPSAGGRDRGIKKDRQRDRQIETERAIDRWGEDSEDTSVSVRVDESSRKMER